MPRSIQPRTPLVIALTIALALLLAWPAWMASQNGLSDLYARPAIDYFEGKRSDAYTVGQAEWLAIENNLVQADRLMPGNPRYLETLGLLQQLKPIVFDDELGFEEIDPHANSATYYFQKAVESRPTWPYYWGNLALEHYRLGNHRAGKYSLALANASRFGPWENGTQQLVLDLGSESWELLSPNAKREFILSVERGLQRQPQNTMRIVLGYDTWPKVCEASKAQFNIDLLRLQALCANESFVE